LNCRSSFLTQVCGKPRPSRAGKDSTGIRSGCPDPAPAAVLFW
jgi:hypothetical protein